MKVLMVCLGNICRSPIAEGILQKYIDDKNLDWETDSAGTSGWHNGEQPDSRSIDVSRKNGIDISGQRSRKFVKADFSHFDLILAMDTSNYKNILTMAESDEDKSKVKLILNYSFPGENRAVPDPYYDGGFDHVYDLLRIACEDLLAEHLHHT